MLKLAISHKPSLLVGPCNLQSFRLWWSGRGESAYTADKNILGSLCLAEIELEKKVKCLSGGEKTKIWHMVNSWTVNLCFGWAYLIILDLKSKDVLKEALWPLTVHLILVSHRQGFFYRTISKVVSNSRINGSLNILRPLDGLFKYVTNRKFKGNRFKGLNWSFHQYPTITLG